MIFLEMKEVLLVHVTLHSYRRRPQHLASIELIADINLLQRPTRPRANTKAAVAPKRQESSAERKRSSTSEPEVWTEEDDNKLRELKTGGKMSWKQILAELGDKHTAEGQMRARWKEIEGKPVGGSAAGGGSEKSKKEEEKKARAEKAKAEGLARQAAAREAKEGKEGKAGKKKGILKVASTLVCGRLHDMLTFLLCRTVMRSPHHLKRQSSSIPPPSTIKTSGWLSLAGISTALDKESAPRWPRQCAEPRTRSHRTVDILGICWRLGVGDHRTVQRLCRPRAQHDGY